MTMRFIILIFTVMLFASCSKEKVIKDRDLELILHDMFLQNAFSKNEKLDLDSLNMYEPIFKKYGYREQDMLRTLTIFSRRKSSRFSDVLDRAASRLDREIKGFSNQIAMLDTVINISERRYGQLVYIDSLIRMDTISDAHLMNISLPSKEGKYRITYRYKFGESKKNFSVKAEFYAQDTLKKRLSDKNMWLNSSNVKDVMLEIDVPAGSDSLMGSYLSFPRNVTFVPVVVDSIRIMYYLPQKKALDSLLREYINYEFDIENFKPIEVPLDSLSQDSLLYDDFIENFSQDSLPQGVDTTGLIIKSNSIN